MIHQLATKHQKKAALFLFCIFYLELVLPNVASAFSPAPGYEGYYWNPVRNRTYFDHGHTFNGINNRTGNREFFHPKSEKKFSPKIASKTNIGGPGQPEMSSFKSVNSNDMVDLFTGDFSYNIPLMDVGGYPVNIHYSSNVSMDQEASWVGFGWNVNPGTISRSVRGLPDDFNGTDTIGKTQSVKENKTVGVTVGGDIEFIGLPLKVGASTGVFHNTYNGWGTETGINASINVGSHSFASLTGGLSLSNNSQTGLNASSSLNVKLANTEDRENGRSVGFGLSSNYNSRSGISALQLSASVRLEQLYTKNLMINSAVDYLSHPSATISFAVPSYTPSVTMPYTSTNYSFTGKVGTEFIVTHPSLFISGYVSKQEIKAADKTQAVPAVGFLYYSKSNNKPNVLMDFNREKDLTFNTTSTPHIAIPQYTYDVYSISGEGTGGMFRPYRGDVGYVRDYNMRTKSQSDKLSVDLGFGNIFHAGVDFSYTQSYSENSSWNANNTITPYIRFGESDTTYQDVYFRNPGEKTTNTQAYYQSIGDDALMRVKLTGSKTSIGATNSFLTYKNGTKTGEIPVNNSITKKERDKKSQVISYLNAYDAAIYGLDKGIVSYKENTVPINGCTDSITTIPRYDGNIRKAHHLSEITVLNGDGRRYVYGIPAYNQVQKDVTFSVDPGINKANVSNGLVQYTSQVDNSVNNTQGKEGLFTKDSMPGYAHSFLLTGIISPDYVDIKGDGITSDDIGDAVKFNYTRIYGDSNKLFEWRTPFDSARANYNEGLKTYSRDDKGTYMYGKKEVWYLNSIESKTMIAVFRISADRKDIFSVAGEEGGLDKQRPLRKLDKIDLFAKADLVKNGSGAKPIKTVHFVYSYRLCKGVAGDPSTGKLTLDSIWFSYNGNEKGKLNPYVFHYHNGTDSASFNPSYNSKAYDRWGNYKDPTTNPGGLINSDYPYAQQDSILASQYAAAWTMSDIQLPSGGKIAVTYEADDYGFVQNKRATQFFQVVGISQNSSNGADNALYTQPNSGQFDNTDFFYVYIKSTVALANKTDIYRKYLQGNDYIYFKLAVQVPPDKWGSGYEFVPVYAQVEDYDVMSGGRFWLKLKKVGHESPLARSAVQFLRLNIPSKAYPNSEPGDDVGVWDIVKMLASSFPETKNAVEGFGRAARAKAFCKFIDTTKSFVRLNSPNYKKYGGGHRVKRIQIFDNWNKMTGQKEAVYGQEYSYIKKEKVFGQDVVMSSGVASYEPMIGAEENPFRAPIPYAEKIAPLAPVDNLFSEQPLGESYYPSAMVGYSKVRVRTINAKAKSANGWAESEFYTTREFPTLIENTILDQDAKRPYNPVLQSFLRINTLSHITLSQGFKIELNDMNGKVRAQSTYAETDSLRPISYTRNFYKVDNDTSYQKHLNNSVWIVDSLNGHINQNGLIGKDIEIMEDMRQQTSNTIARNASANVDIFFIGFFVGVIPSFLLLPQREETRFRSSATVKIIQRYGILDSVVAMDKGSIVTTKNLLYDGETGEVVLSRTNNEFNDPVFNFSYPAQWAYSGMGMAYKNIDAIFKNVKLVRGKLYYGGQSTIPYPADHFFESGDEIKLIGATRTVQTDSCQLFSMADVLPYKPLQKKAWVINASKGSEGSRGLYFIDADGKLISGMVDTIRILRSGKRNILDASVGNIVSMASPIKQVNGQYRLVFDSTIRIIHTSAVTYKDFWKVTNITYPFDTCYSASGDTTVTINSGSNVLLRYKRSPRQILTVIDSKSTSASQVSIPFTFQLAASYDFVPLWMEYRTKSIINFDFSNLPFKNSITSVNSATLRASLYPATNLWPHDRFPFNAFNHNWSSEFRSTGGSYGSFIKRIDAPWDQNTEYLSFSTSTLHESSINSVPPTGTDLQVSCTSLISDVLTSHLSYYGLMFELQNPVNTVGYPHFYSISNYFSHLTHPPLMDINYSYRKDSCIYSCKNYFNDSMVNPYRWGILGNWRTDKAYTYYSDRKESDASIATTNIRKDGELLNFTSFWKFSDSVLQQNPDTTKWVWNTASTLYNKKGFEIENYDPLGRYNAGLYGYDQSLPVAVAQNSKYRELLFDGFEDYSYQTKQCIRCASDREFDFVKNNSGVSITTAESHTGKSSIKVLANSEAKITVPIIQSETFPDSLFMKVDSTISYNTTVVGVGMGLTGTYVGNSSANCPLYPVNPNYTHSIIEGPINFNWGDISPFPDMCQDWFTVRWKGKIQAPFTSTYNFYSISDRTMQVFVNGINVSNQINPNVYGPGQPITLYAGQLYDIEVRYSHTRGSFAYSRLSWTWEGNNNGLQVVPKQFLYKDSLATTDTVGSVITNITRICVYPHNSSTKNVTRPTFSPKQNDKFVISGWVKMDGNDCNTAPTLDSVLVATMYNYWNSPTVISLQKTGVRIEGWQRYEATITMISYGAQFKLSALAPSGRNLYVDDIRVQPYNSSMKSYAYDPVTLRLMAELDENNYATFYEYDDDGTLIRVKKETERGIMTVKETRSGLLKNN